MESRNTIIKEDCTTEEWEDFERHIEMTRADELAAVADRLGASQQSTWQDYRDTFSQYEWSKFIEAYEHCTYGKY